MTNLKSRPPGALNVKTDDMRRLWPVLVQQRRDAIAYQLRVIEAMLAAGREAASGGASEVEGVRSRCVVEAAV